MTFSGAGAHHMDADAERGIGTIVSLMARIRMIHAKLRWPDAITPALWPKAVDYTANIYNSGPRNNNTCPLDILLRTVVPRSRLLALLHVWGCPAWVLHPKLQEGGKIPTWDPRSHDAIFVGLALSKRHTSTVPLVITSQFHVVFDDWFSTVASLTATESLDPHVWTDIFSNSRHQVFFDVNDPIELSDEWLSNDDHRECVDDCARRDQAAAQQREPVVPFNNVPRGSTAWMFRPVLRGSRPENRGRHPVCYLGLHQGGTHHQRTYQLTARPILRIQRISTTTTMATNSLQPTTNAAAAADAGNFLHLPLVAVLANVEQIPNILERNGHGPNVPHFLLWRPLSMVMVVPFMLRPLRSLIGIFIAIHLLL